MVRRGGGGGGAGGALDRPSGLETARALEAVGPSPPAPAVRLRPRVSFHRGLRHYWGFRVVGQHMKTTPSIAGVIPPSERHIITSQRHIFPADSTSIFFQIVLEHIDAMLFPAIAVNLGIRLVSRDPTRTARMPHSFPAPSTTARCRNDTQRRE